MGIHPEFSSFDRRSAHLDEARRTMWLWAEPIIIDRAVEAYGRWVDESGTIALARKHCRLWRSVLLDQSHGLASQVDEIRRNAESLGLTEAVIGDIDDLILEELVDIVTSRFRSSRNTMRALSLVLMSATSSLGTVRYAS